MVWDDLWILERCMEYDSIRELCTSYNHAHGTDICRNTFKAHMRRLNIKCKAAVPERYTEAEKAFISAMYPLYGSAYTARMFLLAFPNTKHTEQSIRSYCRASGIKMSNGKFREIMSATRSREIPVGSTRIRGKMGQIAIKVSDTEWEWLHHHEYKKAYGDIPDGHIVIFVDGDVTNCKPSNLLAVKPNHLSMLNANDMKAKDKTLLLACIEWCKLNEEMKRDIHDDESIHSRRNNTENRSRQHRCCI